MQFFQKHPIIKRWWIFTAMTLILMLVNLDLMVVNIAIPTIARDLNAQLYQMQWTVSIYLLLSVVFMTVGGRFSDIFGKFRVFIFGVLLFVLGSLGAGFAVNVDILNISRMLQGAGMGMTFPIVIVALMEVFPEELKAFAVGLIGTLAAIMQALGPTLGGAIVKYLSWRWIFLLNVPVCFLSIMMVFVFALKETRNQDSIDVKGFLVFASGMFLFVLSFIESAKWGVFSAKTLFSFILGLFLLISFYFVEKRVRHPLVDFSIFKIKIYKIVSLLRIFCQYIYFAMIFFVPIYLQGVLGYNPFIAGLIMIFLGAATGIFSPLAGKLYPRLGGKGNLIISSSLYLITSVLFLLLYKESMNLLELAIPLVLLGLAGAFLITGSTTTALSVVPGNKKGAASGIFFTLAMLGGVIAVALSGSVFNFLSVLHLSSLIDLTHFSTTQVAVLSGVTHGIHSVQFLKGHFAARLVPHLGDMAHEGFLFGFRFVQIINCVLALLALVLAMFVTSKESK